MIVSAVVTTISPNNGPENGHQWRVATTENDKLFCTTFYGMHASTRERESTHVERSLLLINLE